MTSYQRLKAEIDRLNIEIGRLNRELDTVCLAPDTLQAMAIIGSRKIRMELRKALAFGNGAGSTEGNGLLSAISHAD
jgi:hypothetical protein